MGSVAAPRPAGAPPDAQVHSTPASLTLRPSATQSAGLGEPVPRTVRAAQHRTFGMGLGAYLIPLEQVSDGVRDAFLRDRGYGSARIREARGARAPPADPYNRGVETARRLRFRSGRRVSATRPAQRSPAARTTRAIWAPMSTLGRVSWPAPVSRACRTSYSATAMLSLRIPHIEGHCRRQHGCVRRRSCRAHERVGAGGDARGDRRSRPAEDFNRPDPPAGSPPTTLAAPVPGTMTGRGNRRN